MTYEACTICGMDVRADAQTTVSVIFRMLTLLMFDPERGVIWHRGTDAPGDRERFFTLHQLAAAKLEQRFVEATALLINCANYGTGALHRQRGTRLLTHVVRDKEELSRITN